VPIPKHAAGSGSSQWWPGAGKAFVWPSLGEAIIKLMVLYVLLVVIAAVLSFVFKSSPASWPSTILFWVIALALAVWIFNH
jgi:hypothetical protein